MSALTRPAGIGGVKEDKLSMVQSSAFLPVACCAGVVFGGIRLLGHPGFGKVPPWRKATTLMRTTPAITPGGTTLIVTIGMSRVASRWDAGVAQMQTRGLADTNASLPSSTVSGGMSMSGGFGSSNVVAEARRYIGGNPTSRGKPVVRTLHEHGSAALPVITAPARTWRVRSQATASACPDRRSAPSP